MYVCVCPCQCVHVEIGFRFMQIYAHRLSDING